MFQAELGPAACGFFLSFALSRVEDRPSFSVLGGYRDLGEDEGLLIPRLAKETECAVWPHVG